MTKVWKGGKGNLRAKNRTRAPPHSQGLSSETVCWAKKGRDVAGDLGPGCRKEPPERTQPAEQWEKRVLGQLQRQPYSRELMGQGLWQQQVQ